MNMAKKLGKIGGQNFIIGKLQYTLVQLLHLLHYIF